MRLLPLLCFYLTLLLTVSCTASDGDSEPTASPSATAPEMRQIPAVVQEVTVEKGESQTVQIQVKGEFQDGCDVPIQVKQSRENQVINIQLYRELPKDIACASVITEFEKEIALEGGLASGTYTLDVNGELEEITINN
ncbi:hypothetical protein PN462_20510 [Spirulina sp. CS-785/01]|uniref:hypothetical protein n=1 Tax=Spirulina sp. CS-785/01 TaxID=3021716 RepID=UPI00232DB39E|nr:hypothetical protein [Spirulina sp. CS-785/01]MDB9315508.1 hypothetical protein [Spirulina sp. CS-785/01]